MNRVLFPAALFVLLLSGCSSPVPAATSATSAPASAGAGSIACDYQTDQAGAARPVDKPDAQAVNTGTQAAVLTLNETPIQLTLDREAAPCTVNSFVSLAQQGYFDDVACHRLVDGNGLYVLQCGDPTGTGSGGPGYSFADELEKTDGYPAGTLAMANTGQPVSNGSQFFIVYADSQLPNAYTVFGKADAEGVKALTAIAEQGQDNSFGASGGGKPHAPAVIRSVSFD